ncbi:hypothetical protein [Streptomyces sp. NPDC092307]|uniref:hypothetical protein n=1 Tax=Streptomyces sp. NPDC092307 TaxID=3366013 RepID=UPI00381B829A
MDRLDQELDRQPEIRRRACALAARKEAADTERLQEQIGAAETAETAASDAAAEAGVLHRQAREAHQTALAAWEKFLPAAERLTVVCISERERELEETKVASQQTREAELSCCLQEAAIGRNAGKAASDAMLLAQTATALGRRPL